MTANEPMTKRARRIIKRWGGRSVIALIPLLLVGGLVLLQVLFAERLLDCTTGNMGCKGIDIKNVLETDSNVLVNDVSELLASKTRSARNAEQLLNDKLKLIDDISTQIEDESRTADERKRLETVRAGLIKEKDNVVKEKEKAEKELANVRAHIGKRYGGRISWLFLLSLFWVLCITAFAVSAGIIYKSFAVSSRRAIVWAIAAILISFLFGLILHVNPQWHMPIYESLFEKTISHDVTRITQATTFNDSLGYAAAFSLVLASFAILFPPHSADAKGLEQLSERMGDLRLVLYVGTLMLVTTVLLTRAIFQWSLAFIVQEKQSLETAEAFYSSLTSMEGGFFTLVLAAVYLPTAFILQRRAHLLKLPPGQESKKEEILKARGLTFSFTESLPRIVAILGPLLAGPVGELFTRLAK